MQVSIHEAKTRLSKLIGGFFGKTRIGGLKGKKFKMTEKFDDAALNTEIALSFDKP